MNEKQRAQLLSETQETAVRLNMLNVFMATDAFPSLPREDKDLLYWQQRVMGEYVQILCDRLERAGQLFASTALPCTSVTITLPSPTTVGRTQIGPMKPHTPDLLVMCERL